MNDIRIKMRFLFSKKGNLIYISHQDLMRTLERLFRRAAVPMAWTQGFNPHLKIHLPCPLQLGISGCQEPGELLLESPMDADAFLQQCNASSVPGLQFMWAEPVAVKQKWTPLGAIYTVRGLPFAIPQEKIESLLRETSLMVFRSHKKREVDIRPYLLRILAKESGDLQLDIKLSPAGSARVEEVLSLLGAHADHSGIKIIRKRINFECQESKQTTEKFSVCGEAS